MRTALVLGAGGLVGHAFHLGVLRALDSLVGCDGRPCYREIAYQHRPVTRRSGPPEQIAA